MATATATGAGSVGARYARTDWAPFVAALGLTLVGALLIWSSTKGWAGTALAVRHLVNVEEVKS